MDSVWLVIWSGARANDSISCIVLSLDSLERPLGPFECSDCAKVCTGSERGAFTVCVSN